MNIGTADSDQSPISSNGTVVRSEKATRMLEMIASPKKAIDASATPIGTRNSSSTISIGMLR